VLTSWTLNRFWNNRFSVDRLVRQTAVLNIVRTWVRLIPGTLILR
jgi:hypothetical protein